jgi:hypothetical protein
VVTKIADGFLWAVITLYKGVAGAVLGVLIAACIWAIATVLSG